MKKRYGFFHRAIALGILLGLIGTAGLCFLGYQKANEAEASAIAAADLRSAYIGDTEIPSDPNLLENILTEYLGDSEIIKDITAILSDDSVAEMIVKSEYLPDDGEISTAIGQKILTHRLTKFCSEEELLLIWCAMMGYDPAAFRESTAEETASILSDLLNY